MSATTVSVRCSLMPVTVLVLLLLVSLSPVAYPQEAAPSGASRTPPRTPQICVSLQTGAQADAPFELWQTGCSYGTVFALRVSLVRKQQVRRKNRAGHSNPARNREHW